MRTTCFPCIISRASKHIALSLRCLAIAILLPVGLMACDEQSRLPALGVDITQTSVSGLSSGAYMASQFHFVHSKTVIGAGIVAGGPYGCAESIFSGLAPPWPIILAQNLNRAVNACTGTLMANIGIPNLDRLARHARDRANDKAIDPLADLKDDRVYLFSGKSDRTVAPSLVRMAAGLYKASGVTAENIVLSTELDAGHAFITEDEGGACDASETPFLNDCDFDQAGEILKHIYEALLPPAAESGEILLFSQAEFSNGSGHGLDEMGVVFIPNSCTRENGDEQACRVHVVFHGCRQGREKVGDAFVNGAGFNRWAGSNRLVVLYPQIRSSTVNPRGCWDWWGYTGREFLTRNSPQIMAVRAMLERLAQPRGN